MLSLLLYFALWVSINIVIVQVISWNITFNNLASILLPTLFSLITVNILSIVVR